MGWSKPLVDGNSGINNYVIEKRETSHLSWILVDSNCTQTSMKVNKLLAGNEYVFRVPAENKIGLGDVVESVETLAKNPWTVPSAPTGIEIRSVTKTTVTVCWSRPEKDGGNAIEEYIVEKRLESSIDWHKANKKACYDTSFKVCNLMTG